VFSEQVSPKCPKKACGYSLISEQYYTIPMLVEMVAEMGWKQHTSNVWRYGSIACFQKFGNTMRSAGRSKRRVRLFDGK